MSNIVLVGFKRSPFTIANKGLLANVRPEDILSQVINDLIKTTNINKDDIEDDNSQDVHTLKVRKVIILLK